MAYNQTKLHVNLYVQLTVGFIKSRVKFSFLTTHSLNNLIPRFALLRLAALGLRKIASLGIRLLNSLGQKTKFHSRQNGSHCFLHIQVNKNHLPISIFTDPCLLLSKSGLVPGSCSVRMSFSCS